MRPLRQKWAKASEVDFSRPTCDNYDMAKAPSHLTDTLRRLIRESENSMVQLSAKTGIVRGSLIRFARGDSSLRLDIADKLVDFFELELKRKKKD